MYRCLDCTFPGKEVIILRLSYDILRTVRLTMVRIRIKYYVDGVVFDICEFLRGDQWTVSQHASATIPSGCAYRGYVSAKDEDDEMKDIP